MEVRILDLDGSVAKQHRLAARARRVLPLDGWGPNLRMACGWEAFGNFEVALARHLNSTRDAAPTLSFLGSGDFHHLSLAMDRRVRRRCNLLVIDNHPDWMRGVPFLHCGTWVYHAARLPWVDRVFHVGGEVDFDNFYRHAAPWKLLQSGKIVALPAIRRMTGRRWAATPHEVLRPHPEVVVDRERIETLLEPYRADLARRPLYVSLDRDVLTAEHATINWDSGRLTPPEVFDVLDAFREASRSLVGMDVVGDWSPVHVAGLGRWLLHLTEHPHGDVDSLQAQRLNETLNLALVERMRERKVSPLRLAARRGTSSPYRVIRGAFATWQQMPRRNQVDESSYS